jgi:hypothetical protein
MHMSSDPYDDLGLELGFRKIVLRLTTVSLRSRYPVIDAAFNIPSQKLFSRVLNI